MYTRILLAFSSSTQRERLSRLLDQSHLACEIAADASALWEKVRREDFDLLLIGRELLPGASDEVIAALHSLPEHPAVIVLAEEDNPDERAELLAEGCDASLWLGLEDRSLRRALLALVERQGEQMLDRLGSDRGEKRSTLAEFISSSPSMQRFVRVARRLVKSDSALLILGETGVGKERLARSIHSESRRSGGPFITVNCGALPETLLESELFGHEKGAFTGATRARRGYFELAHRGTIFLDEIGEMPLHLQVKLLRVLEDRSVQRVGGERPVEVDIRVMAATNRELRAEMEAERFRPDLYYRLAVVTLTVPPLRERREDIPELARNFVGRFRGQLGTTATSLSPEAIGALMRHEWPGNVRELMNVIERAVLLCHGTEIGLSDLRSGDSWTYPERVASRETPSPVEENGDALAEQPFRDARAEVLRSFERRYLTRLLEASKGRVGVAATRAGLNERSLYAMMKRHGLRKEDFKSTPS